MQQVGKYQLVRQLAMGGMAEVFLARTAGPGGFEKLLVLKRILPHMAREPAFIQMFLSEATLAARLTHPNIVHIFDFGETDGSYYLAMEYIDGPSLRTLLDDAIRMGTPLPPVVCARIIAAACEGLAFAHDFRDPSTGQPLDIVHRDISPDNILLSRQGAVKVVDFGIAKAVGQRHKTQTGMIKGKLAYMPPEQIRNQVLDRRVDVYALGVVFYELVTGQRPFDAPTDAGLMHSILFETPMPAALRQPELPEPVLRIIKRAMSKDRDQRYPDCNAFQADLEEFILSTGKPVTTQHIAQLIAQVSPPAYSAPLPPLPAGSPPLEDTALRPASSQGPLPSSGQDSLAPKSPPLADTEIRTAPSLGPLSGMAPQPAPSAVPITASRGKGMLRAALAGVVLLAAGSGYLLWGRTSPTPPALTTPPSPSGVAPPTVAELPPSVTSPANNGSTGDTPSVPEPVSPPPGNASGDASARPPVEAPQVDPNAPGLIEFVVIPEAIVYLEGKKLGRSPPAIEVTIPPGTYRVKLVNKKLKKRVERPVEVKPGQTTFVQVDLLHEEEAQKP